jgi:hypothetical protein
MAFNHIVIAVKNCTLICAILGLGVESTITIAYLFGLLYLVGVQVCGLSTVHCLHKLRERCSRYSLFWTLLDRMNVQV